MDNPIEQVFAKLKTMLRKAAARTVEATCKCFATYKVPLMSTKPRPEQFQISEVGLRHIPTQATFIPFQGNLMADAGRMASLGSLSRAVSNTILMKLRRWDANCGVNIF